MEIKVGDTVRFLDRLGLHAVEPSFYPKKGTIGTVVKRVHDDAVLDSKCIHLVQWETGNTSDEDEWWAFNIDLELVSEIEAKNGLD